MTTAAVTIIVLAVFTLVVMTGIGGYTVGRAHAADAAKKASEADSRLNETLVGCRDKLLSYAVCSIFRSSRPKDTQESPGRPLRPCRARMFRISSWSASSGRRTISLGRKSPRLRR